MSRIPRHLEYLKTGSTAEALSAARYRANAARAERDGHVELAARWRELAVGKDELAIALLEAASQVLGGDGDIGTAMADERYENDVLYPKLKAAAGDAGAEATFALVIDAQKEHLAKLTRLRESFNTNPSAPVT